MKYLFFIGDRRSAAQLFVLLVLSQLSAIDGICQPVDFWAAKPRYTLDLHSHGYRDFDRNEALGDGGQLAFVSDSVIVGAIAQRSRSWAIPPTNVYAFNLQRNTVRDVPEIPVVTSLFCPISGRRVALTDPSGISECGEELNCRVVLKAGEVTASPLGNRLAVQRRPGGPYSFVDTGTWKTAVVVSLPRPLDRIIPGDEHFYTRPGMNGELVRDDGRHVHLPGPGLIADVQFLDANRIAVTQYDSAAVVVFDLDGREQFRIKTDSASRVSLLRAASAGRFGVVELGYTFWGRMLHFLDLERGRGGGLQRVRVFETANGKQVAEYESTPPGGSGFALSPNGHLLALERGGQVRVVAIP